MKITISQYAKSLYVLTEGKSKKEIDLSVAAFADFLGKNRQISLGKKIGEKFAEIYNLRNGIVEAEVKSVWSLDQISRAKVVDFIRKKYAAKEVFLKELIDKNIQGGIVIRVGDEILDSSIVAGLRELRELLSK